MPRPPEPATVQQPAPHANLAELAELRRGKDSIRSTVTADFQSSLVRRRATWRSSGRRLMLDVPPGLLRGVRLEAALGKFGVHWLGSTTGGVGAAGAGAEYELSEEVTELDDFVSHDWGTPGWLKFLALCSEFNTGPAFVAAALVCAVAAALESNQIGCLPLPLMSDSRWYSAPTGCWAMVFGSVAYVVVFMFYQRLRQLACRRPRIIFVDKLCIDQTDERRKTEGILAIAGFLQHSDRLLVLWSPRYFTRIWCVYEVASWLYLEKDVGQGVRFVPVALSSCLLCYTVGSLPLHLATMWAMQLQETACQLAAIAVAMFLSMAAPVYFARRLVRDLQLLPLQLQNFSSRDAQCFCCQCGHQHPYTGKKLSCDRRLILKALQEWFHDDEVGPGETDEFLDVFDSLVRGTFAESVLSSVGGTRMRYGQALAASAFGMCFWVDRLPPMAGADLLSSFRVSLLYVYLVLGVYPAMPKIILSMAAAFDARRGTPQSAVLDVLLTLAQALAVTGTAGALWLAAYVTVLLDSPVPQFVVMPLLVAIIVSLFRGPCARGLAPQPPVPPRPTPSAEVPKVLPSEAPVPDTRVSQTIVSL